MTSTLHIARAAVFFGVLAIIALSACPRHRSAPHRSARRGRTFYRLLRDRRRLRARILVKSVPDHDRPRSHAVGRVDGDHAVVGARPALGDRRCCGQRHGRALGHCLGRAPAKSRRPSVTEAGSPRHTGAPQSYTNGHLD